MERRENIMFPDRYKNAQVVTSDGKKLGTVKSLDSIMTGTFETIN
jgi:sporulation protein YlmC with PRC-barrel domain